MKTKTSVLMALVSAIVILGFSSITLATDYTYSGASLARNWTGICNGGVTEVTFTGSVFKMQPILAGIPIPTGNVRCYAAYIQGDTLYIAQRVNGMLVFMPYNPQDAYIPYYDISYFDGNSWTPTAFDSYMPNGTSVTGKSFFFGIAPLDVNTIADFAEKFYGDWINFKAPTDTDVTGIYEYDTVPVVIIDDSDNYGIIPTSSSTATIVGYIVSDGGRTLSARGVCYGRTENPDLTSGTCVSSTTNSSLDVFTTTLSGLSSNTLYHARAYATNSIGTNYSQDVKFATQVAAPGDVAALGVKINSIGASQTRAVVNSTIASGDNVIERGVCYGTAANPSYPGNPPPGALPHTYPYCIADSGIGSGTFNTILGSGAITSANPLLMSNTSYHARTYAVISGGTVVYSADYPFTTAQMPGPAAIATPVVGASPAGVAPRTATVSTTIASASPITAAGVCYSAAAITNAGATAAIATPGILVGDVVCTADNILTQAGQLLLVSTLPTSGLQLQVAGGANHYVVYAVNSSGNPSFAPIDPATGAIADATF